MSKIFVTVIQKKAFTDKHRKGNSLTILKYDH